MIPDTDLLDWLERIPKKGYSPSILHDDNGHWTVSFSGVSSVSGSFQSTYVEETQWHPSLRGAILAAMMEVEEDGAEDRYCTAKSTPMIGTWEGEEGEGD